MIVVQNRLLFNGDNDMPRRHILTARQKSALLDLPTDEVSLLRYYTLADDDLANIHGRRRPENKLGFALQLCVLRYPGRTLFPGELIPKTVLSFIAAQLGISADVLITYAIRRQTRQEHMEILRNIYGYKIFSGHVARHVSHWLRKQAEEVRSNEELAQQLVNHCREYLIILPAFSTIERLCADALVFAERKIELLIVSRFIWLRNFEAGNNSAVFHLAE